MNIPLNGRIAIVDDRYKEVEPLMKILAKKRIPFNYYTGLKKAELPDQPDDNPVTLLFMDLNIIETQNNPKTVISTLHPILKALCPVSPKPYFLVMWSKKLNDFADQLERHFRSNPDLKNRKPVKFIRLNKADFFTLEDGKYIFEEGKYNSLIDALKMELENVSLLKNFLLWENIVHDQTSETVSEFSSFYDINDDWNKNTKAIIFHLAKATVGDESIATASDDLKLLLAFSSINSFLSDKIQQASGIKKLGAVTEIIDDQYSYKKNKEGRLKNGIRGKINAKLHVSHEPFDVTSFEQGNVYKIKNENNLIKRVLDKEKYNNIKSADIIKSKPSLIQLDLTPVCDYAQDKKYIRLIYGLLIDAKFSEINIHTTYQRQTPTFHFNKKEKFIILDYRFIKTMTKEDIRKRKVAPIIRLRREICTDVQSQLANQINRPGINNV